MQGKFGQFGVTSIWHFTDRSNIDLIKQQGGLLCLEELERRGVQGFIPGGNDWSHEADERKGLKSYVHLAFIPNHPMQYAAVQDGRIKDPVWLKIKAQVALVDGVRFTADVSNKSGVPILTPEEARDELDFEVLFKYLDWTDPMVMARRKAAEKSEILVPEFVSVNQIEGVCNG